jgi:hypothetical protein
VLPGETVMDQERMGLSKDPHVSEFQVMESEGNRLFYIGTLYKHDECEVCKKEGLPPGFEEPNSRETDYFSTKDEAKAALEKYKETGTLDKMRF